jgi:glycosyltransferase involved in cell wall biosynthesis
VTPEASRPRRRVSFCVNDYWGCGWYRCFVPGFALQRLGYEVILDKEISRIDVAGSDVLVVQSPSVERQLDAIRMANRAGVLSVVELDDDVWNLPPANPSHASWNRPGVLATTRACVEEAQLVTTPTHVLAEKLRTMNANVKVLANQLPPDDWDYPEPKVQREGGVVLGWAGSNSHAGDLRIVDAVVRQLLDRYPDLEVVIGSSPSVMELGEHERVRRIEETDIEGYPKLLEHFDVGMIPLADTAFNRNKSDLKFVEYSMLGIPSVASKLDPYARTVKHGETGFLASTPKDWLKYLSRLIEDVELRRTVGVRAQEYARTRGIDANIGRWVRAYGMAEPSGS